MRVMQQLDLIPAAVQRDAVLSPCRRYRYVLSRDWGVGPVVAVVGLNPSTADELDDDRTLLRCMAFARVWGFAGLRMVNLFGYRATEPKVMMAAADPIGPLNDGYLLETASKAALTVAAWGNGGRFLGRDQQVARVLPRLHALRVTRAGSPAHPLYLPGSLRPVPWAPDVNEAIR